MSGNKRSAKSDTNSVDVADLQLRTVTGTYVHNPATGKNHKVTAALNNLGENTLSVDQNGVALPSRMNMDKTTIIEELEKKLEAARKDIDVAMRAATRAARASRRLGGASCLPSVETLGVALAVERAAWDTLKAARAQ